MIVYKNWTGYETHDDFPNTDWRPPHAQEDDPAHVVDETTAEGQALADKIRRFYPGYILVEETGVLVDVTDLPHIYYKVTGGTFEDGNYVISAGEVLTINIHEPQIVRAEINGAYYRIADGVIEYSNDNPGHYYILLEAKGYTLKNIFIKVVA